MNRPAPYIGVSGFMSSAEVRAALCALSTDRLLMVGVLASHKTIVQGVANKYPRRYPKREDIADIFVDDPRCLNLVHVGLDIGDWRLSFDDLRTRRQNPLREAMRYGGPLCHGVQINMAWPTDAYDVGALAAFLGCFREAYPTARVVFQYRIGGEHFDAEEVAANVCYAVGCGVARVNDVLLDASGGTGKALDLHRVGLCISALRSRMAWLNYGPTTIGIAGGLYAETLPEIAEYIRAGISIDAEGRLRDGADGGGNLDLDKTRAYVATACEIVGGAL